MKTIDKIRRRTFLKLTGVTGAFLVVGCVPSSSKDTAVANLLTEEGDIKGLNQFVIIDTSGKIVLFNHRPEMGQGTYQAVPMILAEELEVDLNEVEIRHSPADKELYGNQMVVGSQSIRREYEVLRKVAAGTREILILAAAKIWEEKPEDCYAANGKVINRLGDKSLHYGDLVTTAMGIKVPESPKMKAPGDFKVIGQPLARRDIPDKVSGKTIFGLDVNVPGMLYASVERAKVFLGKLVSYDDRATLKVPGVKQVLKTKRVVWGHEREGVAVLADSYWAAEQGRKALKVEWDNGDAERHSTEKIFEKYRQDARLPGNTLHEDGDVDKALANATGVLEASYETPYQSHSPMEPMNAIVSVTEDKVEFWGSTQNPNGVRSYLANQMGMDEAQVTVNYTFMGGAFGRRSMTDVAEEAADLSRQAKVPVKVVWTRQDDLTQGPFRACSLNAFKGSLDKEGRILALEHKVICQEISNQTGDRMEAGGQLRGGINMDYAIPNFRINGVLQKHDVPISYWRSVYHSTNTFAHEGFIDELAHQAEKDPLEFRLDMLKEHPRFTKVLKTVAERSGWFKNKKGKGVAIVERSGSFIALVCEVFAEGEKVKIRKITCVVDVGICINPDTVKAQCEGSIVMGLTAAIKSSVNIKNGQVAEQNFDTYHMMTYDECPEIETFVVESTDPPEGAGETGLPVIAPALTNAIFSLTGKRFRKLPLRDVG